MSGMHAAVIMDGNGRWARQRGMPRWRGHLAGVESVRDTVRGSPDLGITTLTLYAFSSDNWKRPSAEVGRLFWLLREYCRREQDELIANGARVTQVGRRDRLPGSARVALERLEQATAEGGRLHLRLAIDYSAQWMLADAARRLAADVAAGRRQPQEVTPAVLEEALTDGVPPVDLLIRTAGEQRLSDFLLWESAYAELYFTPVLWPDFRRADLATAVSEFQRRERKFGGLVVRPGAVPEPGARRVAVG
jgi:undecaprenyl diphosphate synthase